MMRVESIGSFWWIDEQLRRYSRTPKIERPRDYPTNGEGTPMEDLQWFEFTRWIVLPIPKDNYWSRKYNRNVVGVVQIHYTGFKERRTPLGVGRFVHAPLERAEYNRLNAEYD